MATAYERVHAAWLLHQREADRAAGRPARALPSPECACSPKCRGTARSREFHGLRAEYAWAVPTEQALGTIRAHLAAQDIPGVVEVGAGGGYWARQLDVRGVDVLAFDPSPIPSRWARKAWFPIQDGAQEVAARHPDRALLLVWPQRPWADEAVAGYRAAGGQWLIYVGQDVDRPRHESICPPADAVVPLPRYDDVYDQLEIWRLQ